MIEQEKIDQLIEYIKYDMVSWSEHDLKILETLRELIKNNTRLTFLKDKCTYIEKCNLDGLTYYRVGANLGAGTDFYDAIDNMTIERKIRAGQ